MSIVPIKKKFNLPPNVNGKCRGYLEISVIEINWTDKSGGKTSKKNQTSSITGKSGLSIKIIWWGEPLQESAIIQLDTLKQGLNTFNNKIVKYSICTNRELFREYLSNSKDIRIELLGNISNLLFGIAVIRIPNHILSINCDSRTSFEGINKSNIINSRNSTIGSITLAFKIILNINPVLEGKMKAIDLCKNWPKNDYECIQNKKYFCFDENCNDCIKFNTLNTKNCAKNNCDYKQYYKHQTYNNYQNNISPNILNYLSGKKMSKHQEEKALNEIQNTSPLGSVVDEIVSNRPSFSIETALNSVDRVFLLVKSIELLPSGFKDISSNSLDNIRFTIECKLLQEELFKEYYPRKSDVIKCYSDEIDDIYKTIYFNKLLTLILKNSPISRCEIKHFSLMFTIGWSYSNSRQQPRCLGTAKYDLSKLIKKSLMESTETIIVKSCTKRMAVCNLNVKIKLGSNHQSFGSNPLSFFNVDTLEKDVNPIKKTISVQCDRFIEAEKDIQLIKERTKNNPNTQEANTQTISTDINQKETISNQTECQINNLNIFSKILPQENNDQNKLDVKNLQQTNVLKLLYGLLYIGSIRNVKVLKNGNYFLVCRAFWKEDETSTQFCHQNIFNFIEIFPIIKDNKFLDRVRNNHLDIELWQKCSNTSEQMVGIIKLPLHQFFIAFRDETITNHLCQAKLPVISIDGWAAINSPLSGELCGQLQVLLAIGTEEQLEYLKISRGLTLSEMNSQIENVNARLPVPELPKEEIKYCEAQTQTNINQNDMKIYSEKRDNFTSLLENFIQTLAQKLPRNNSCEQNINEDDGHVENTSMNKIPIRKTSDLLDNLEKSLSIPQNKICLSQDRIDLNDLNTKQLFKIRLEIENALHLPIASQKYGFKKCSKRLATNSKGKASRLTIDEEPSAYVTFQAEEGAGTMIKSHEGLVYATNVVEKSCKPVWNKCFDIQVPLDLLLNDEKRFILKIWRKTVTDLPQCRLLPNPFEDSVIGFAAIDLNIFMAKVPYISGWYNIIDFNGVIRGQIKVNVHPIDDVKQIKEQIISSSSNNTINQSISCSYNVKDDYNIEKDVTNSILSRAMKRKFTELEEITERLRARLRDVTNKDDDNEVIDKNLAEFEHDLNTVYEEVEDTNNTKIDFAWLGNQRPLNNSESSQSLDESAERIHMISECLKRAELNDHSSQLSESSPKIISKGSRE